MVKATKPPEAEDLPIPEGLFGEGAIDPTDPLWYKRASTSVLERTNVGKLTPLMCKQAMDILESSCQRHLEMNLAEAGRTRKMTLQDLANKNILEWGSNDIECLIRLIEKSKALEDDVKKKCLSLLSKLLGLHQRARKDSMAMWLYVLRDSEGKACRECGSSDIHPAGFPSKTTQTIACKECGCSWESTQYLDSEGLAFFDIEWFHKAWFMAWQHKDWRKTLIQAPPGHGKTTCVRGHRAWKIGKRPTIRMLLLYDVDEKAPRGVELLRRIISHPRYRTIFPGLRVLRRADDAELSKRRFTVSFHNEFSREATVEGYAIRSGVNGNGYDYIGADDICPPEVRWQPYTRNQINERWGSVIEQRLRDPKSAEIDYISTPWDAEDTAGQIIKDVEHGRTRGWLMLVRPFAILDDSEGKAIPLWPQKFTRDVLEDMKARNPNYNCTHRLDPGRQKNKAVRRVRFYPSLITSPGLTDRDKKRIEVIAQSERWLSIDPSASKNEWSSDTGVVECVLTPSGYAYCTEAWFLKLGPVEMQNWIIKQIYYQNDPGYAGIQIEAQGAMVGQVSLWIKSIQDALAEGRIPARKLSQRSDEDDEILSVEPYRRDLLIITTGTRMGGAKQNQSKMHRLNDASRIIENMVYFAGDVVVHDGKPWYKPIKGSGTERLQTILKNFDGYNNSDAVDALTQWCLYNSDRISNPAVIRASTTPAQRTGGAITGAFHSQLEAMQRAAARAEKGDGETEFYRHMAG